MTGADADRGHRDLVDDQIWPRMATMILIAAPRRSL
jgi:hypothetical protein